MLSEARERLAPRKIGCVGTFDVANYGDCLFPAVYMHLLKERIPALEFSFYSPLPKSAGIMDYGPIKALPERLNDVAFDEDVLILCGGETLWFGHSSGTFNFPASTLSAFTRLWLAPTLAASRGDVDFYVHSVGMPHAQRETPDAIGRALLSATGVSVRDAVTAQRLGNRFPVEVDPVFALSTIKTADQWSAELHNWLPDGYAAQGYLAAHISAPYLVNDLDDWCRQVAAAAEQGGLPILLVPVCHFMDDRHTLEMAREILIAQGVDEDSVKLPPYESKDILATAALLGMSGGVITSSLHACVTAASFGAPFTCYVGKGQSNGKHRQTLLAAGIEYGMADDLPSIAKTFAYSAAQDREASRQTAIGEALSGLQRLIDDLAQYPARSRELAAETVEAVLIHDKAPTRGLRSEAKRTILRWIKKSDFLTQLLEESRRTKLRRGILQTSGSKRLR